ncbi:MAG: hypothetical protein ABJM29_03155 [Rhizobiaceae bacterium]
MAPIQTVVCMKWGTRYPAEFVNRLWSMIQRNTTRPTRLICFTEDATGIHKDVEIAPLPQINIPEHVAWTPWRKLSLWQRDLADLEGDILFLDLDMVVTGNLDDCFDYEPGSYCVIHNWTQPKLTVGNTSLFRFPVNKYSHIFERFDADPEAVLNEFRIEQQYISARIPEQKFWPREWCLSFKHDLIPAWPMRFLQAPQLPPTARAVAFTGRPDPDEAAIGQWPTEKAWKKIYKHVRPTPWIMQHWQ